MRPNIFGRCCRVKIVVRKIVGSERKSVVKIVKSPAPSSIVTVRSIRFIGSRLLSPESYIVSGPVGIVKKDTGDKAIRKTVRIHLCLEISIIRRNGQRVVFDEINHRLVVVDVAFFRFNAFVLEQVDIINVVNAFKILVVITLTNIQDSPIFAV